MISGVRNKRQASPNDECNNGEAVARPGLAAINPCPISRIEFSLYAIADKAKAINSSTNDGQMLFSTYACERKTNPRGLMHDTISTPCISPAALIM